MLWAFLLVFGGSFALYKLFKQPHSSRKLLPGPKPRLLVGNALDLPTVTPWRTYHEWRQLYGEFWPLQLALYNDS